MMRIGGGFIFSGVVVIASLVFFGWGLRKPKLERVWELQVGLGSGRKKPLNAEERKLLTQAIQKHPGFVDSLLGDESDIGIISENRDGLIENRYAYLVRRKLSPRRKIELIATDVAGKDPLEVEVRAGKEKQSGSVRAGAPMSWELPDEGQFPQLIEVRVRAKDRRDRHAIVVRTEVLP